MKWTNVSAGKIQVKRFNDAWSKLRSEHKTFVALTGVVGVDERSSTFYAICGSGSREDVTEAQNGIGNLFDPPWTLTKENAADLTAAILAELPALKETRVVKDSRKTPEVAAASAAEYVQCRADNETAQRVERIAWLATYGNRETVTIQPGQMAITARLCFDDSDPMTDYFSSHATLSPEFALLVVPKQAETEKLARRGVGSLLGTFKFDWHTEKYSMGHGNYLESEGFELPAGLPISRKYYRGGTVTHGHWEIQFRAAHSNPVELPAFMGYGSHPEPAQETAAPVSVGEITITENIEKSGIELRFPDKPAADVLDMLKANGWRWSRFSKCWYKKASDAARQFANDLAVVTAVSGTA